MGERVSYLVTATHPVPAWAAKSPLVVEAVEDRDHTGAVVGFYAIGKRGVGGCSRTYRTADAAVRALVEGEAFSILSIAKVEG